MEYVNKEIIVFLKLLLLLLLLILLLNKSSYLGVYFCEKFLIWLNLPLFMAP